MRGIRALGEIGWWAMLGVIEVGWDISVVGGIGWWAVLKVSRGEWSMLGSVRGE